MSGISYTGGQRQRELCGEVPCSCTFDFLEMDDAERRLEGVGFDDQNFTNILLPRLLEDTSSAEYTETFPRKQSPGDRWSGTTVRIHQRENTNSSSGKSRR